MSCGDGSCGCCPKCGCRATCTCNQKLWFDEVGENMSYNVMEVMAKSRQPGGGNCKKCSPTGGAFTGFISEAAAYSAYYG